MIPGRGDEKRRIVPRWRSPQATVEAGEFESVERTGTSEVPDVAEEFSQSLERWRGSPNMGTAAEVIASASMAKREREAVDAATFVKDKSRLAGPLLLERAECLLSLVRGTRVASDGGIPAISPVLMGSYDEMRKQIAPLKRRVFADPQDALAWLEMGRLHATVGNVEQAMRAVRVASSLARDSRYVLRSASRFFLHAGEPDTAHEVLRRSARSRFDPWLSAAEIATAQVAGELPRTIKTAKEMLGGGAFADHDLSELRSALATTSLLDGRKKDARRLLEASLRGPTENAVAQALWVAVNGEMSELSGAVVGSLNTPRSFEARSVASYNAGNWEDALRQARFWYDDEPFSGRAAIHASVIASVAFEKYEEAISILRSALRASPGHFLLQTNLIFNLAQSGKLEEAAALMKEVRPAPDHIPSRVVMLANSGLLLMKGGHLDAGRKAYEEAISLARDSGLRELAEQAMLYFTAEELSAHNIAVLPHAQALLEDVNRMKPPEARVAIARLQRILERLPRE
ncbi:MAG: hypothetical protein IPF87_21130 [Gemmatimonadetes bacterium]|nr:hypothetical protein [Gemmatimonadota bacterium]